MPVEQRTITDRNTWLEWRRQDVTASTVGALFNCHPYCTLLRLYVEKRGVEFPDEDNPVMRRGRWLEPSFVRALADIRPEWQLTAPQLYLRDGDLRIGATPDFFIEAGDPRGRGVLQCKTCAPSVFYRDWAEEPPMWVILQCLTEMVLSGAAFGAVAALVVDPFNMDIKTFEIPRHPAAEARIAEAVQIFWDDVAACRDPEPDYGRDTEVIRAITASATAGKSFDASGNNELPILLAQRAALRARIKADDSRCTEIENELKFLLGDAERLDGLADWRVTYKQVKRTGYTVAPKSSRQLRIIDQRPADQRPDNDEAE